MDFANLICYKARSNFVTLMAKLWLIYVGCLLSLVGGIIIGIGLGAQTLMSWLMMYKPDELGLIVLGMVAFILGVVAVYFAKPLKTPR